MTEAVRAPRASLPNPLAGLDPRRRQLVIVAIIIGIALIYPLIYRSLTNAPVLGFIPWPGTAVLIFCATFAILALGLNIVMGFAGLLDLGYVAFYAIGAYTTAFLASPPLRCPHQLVDRRLDRGRGRGDRRGPAGRPDAEAARRLPGDRDPRLRRDRPPRLPEPRRHHDRAAGLPRRSRSSSARMRT